MMGGGKPERHRAGGWHRRAGGPGDQLYWCAVLRGESRITPQPNTRLSERLALRGSPIRSAPPTLGHPRCCWCSPPARRQRAGKWHQEYVARKHAQ